MSNQNDKLGRLLRDAFPSVEVSPDFTLKLWRGLMKQPAHPPWMMPAPVYAIAAAVGIFAGLWNWNQSALLSGRFSEPRQLAQVVRTDLFGNAPYDSLAGSYLNLKKDI